MKVSLFTSCVVDALFPNVSIAIVEVLERFGVEVLYPENQVCCGQPTLNSGYREESRKVLINQLEAFKDADYVVGAAGSCTASMKEYAEFFKDDPEYYEAAVKLHDKTYEFTQFLYHVLGLRDVGATLNKKVTYHRSCHMTRLLGERESPFELMKYVKGLEYTEIDHIENCCGFGGTFSVKEPIISNAMVTEKMHDVINTGAEVLISADMACLMNIGGKFNREGQPITIMHIAEVLNHDIDLSRVKIPEKALA